MYSTSGTLKIEPPFNLKHSAMFLKAFRPMKDEQETIDGAITKAIMINGQITLFTVKQESPRNTDPISYELSSKDPITKTYCDSAANQISFFLSLTEDIKPFYEIAKKEDPKFYPIIEQFCGFHHVKFPTTLETATWAILVQRNPLSAAKKMKQRLIEKWGESIQNGNGHKFWAFPDYSRLKNVSEKELYPIIRNIRRTQYLASLSKDYEKIDEKSLLELDFDQAKKILMQIDGIGEWSATFILSRGLGRMERLPENLKMISPEIQRLYGSEISLEKICDIYGKWIGYWLLYVWASHLASKIT